MLDNMTLAELYDLVISSPKGGALLAIMAILGATQFCVFYLVVDIIGGIVLPKLESLWRRWREKRKEKRDERGYPHHR